MGKGIRVTPGTHPHAYVAVRTHLAPVVKTGFRIQLPAPGAVDLFLIIRRYGIRWAAVGALFTDFTKVFDTNVDRLIGNQGKVRRHRAQSNPRTEIFGHQVTQSTGFPQPGVHGQGNQSRILMPQMIGGGRIPEVGDKSSQLRCNKSTVGIVGHTGNGRRRVRCRSNQFKRHLSSKDHCISVV